MLITSYYLNFCINYPFLSNEQGDYMLLKTYSCWHIFYHLSAKVQHPGESSNKRRRFYECSQSHQSPLLTYKKFDTDITKPEEKASQAKIFRLQKHFIIFFWLSLGFITNSFYPMRAIILPVKVRIVHLVAELFRIKPLLGSCLHCRIH